MESSWQANDSLPDSSICITEMMVVTCYLPQFDLVLVTNTISEVGSSLDFRLPFACAFCELAKH